MTVCTANPRYRRSLGCIFFASGPTPGLNDVAIACTLGFAPRSVKNLLRGLCAPSRTLCGTLSPVAHCRQIVWLSNEVPHKGRQEAQRSRRSTAVPTSIKFDSRASRPESAAFPTASIAPTSTRRRTPLRPSTQRLLHPQRLVPLRHTLTACERTDLQLPDAPAHCQMHDRHVLRLARPGRDDAGKACLLRRLPRVQRFSQRAALVRLQQHRIGRATQRRLAHPRRLCHQEIVADHLHPVAHLAG